MIDYICKKDIHEKNKERKKTNLKRMDNIKK